MNTFRLHPWMGFLALLAWLSLLIFWMGCRPAVSEVHTSLVVLDAHDAPPASGFALLVDEVSFSPDGTPQSWNAISDTLHWSPLSGETSLSVDNSTSCHWLVSSPDPVSTDRMRTTVIPVGVRDTCRLDAHVPYQLLLRLRQTSQSEPHWRIVLHHSGMEEFVLHDVDNHGGHQFRGHLVAHSFPIKVELRQAIDSDAAWTTLDSTTVPYLGTQTALVAAWSNVEHSSL